MKLTIVRPFARRQMEALLVAVGDSASAWREQARQAELAFNRWQHAAGGHRRQAAADYQQAIEREEKAAEEYRRVWEACCTARC